MRSFKATAGILALVCAVGSGMVVGCSGNTEKTGAGQSSENVGGIGLNLELAEGITVDTVHYVITQGGAVVIEGDIGVADAAATISVLVGGLAPGDYEISLTATSTDGEVTCAGEAPFTITTGTTTAVSVDLQCTNEVTTGVVVVDGQITECGLDVIEYYTAAPLQTSTNGSIALTSSAADVDGQQPDYLWTSTGGVIASPSTPNATFSCDGDAGTHTITLTVSTQTNAGIPGQAPVACEQVVSFDVDCVALSCGNGAIDAGETCDTALDPSCPADCTLPVCQDGDLEGTEQCDDGNANNADNCPNDCTIAACGDSVVEGAEQCDPPNGTTCSATCQNIAVECGNGIVQAGEECDPPNGTTCDSLCQTIEVTVCGDGQITGSETCEPGQSGNCGSSCTDVVSASCFTCQNSDANLVPFLDPHICNFWADTEMPASGPAAGTGVSRRDLCWELLECAFETECAENGPTKCYCGSSGDCSAPNGDCKAAVERAFESTAPAELAGRFADYTFGGAGAFDIANLTRLNASCKTACFTDPAKPINQ